MNKEELLKWLRKNKPYIKISAIGKAAGVPNLNKVVDESPGGNGYITTLPDKYVVPLNKVVKKIKLG